MDSLKGCPLKNLTRKEKEDALESKIIDFEEGFLEIQNLLKSIKEKMKNKATKDQIE